jgi:hypothetical protein
MAFNWKSCVANGEAGMVDGVHEAICDGKIRFYISGGIFKGCVRDDFPVKGALINISSLEFGAFTELWPIVADGLIQWIAEGEKAQHVVFTSKLTRPRQEFFMDLVNMKMTLCFLHEK